VIFMKTGRLTRAALLLLVFAGDAQAATLDGPAMKWPFALPFAGLLLSIAIGPLLFPTVALSLWKDCRRLVGADVGVARLVCWRLGDAGGPHTCHAGRISEFHRASVRALRGRGRAPNFMVASIAMERGIKMPSFFAYRLLAGAIMIVLPVAPILRAN